jgi:hypothetical protein
MLEVEVNVECNHELGEKPPELFLLRGRLQDLVLGRLELSLNELYQYLIAVDDHEA